MRCGPGCGVISCPVWARSPSQRSAGRRRHDHELRTAGAQSPGRSGGGGTGGDHVVDHHDARRRSTSGGEDRSSVALHRAATRLSRAGGPLEQRRTWSAERSGEGARQQLGLVEAAAAPPSRRGRRPGHHIGRDAGGDERRQGPPQAGERAPGVAVLEPGDEVTPDALVGEQRHAGIDARWRRELGSRPQLGRTARAQPSSSRSTHRAGHDQQHPPHPTKGV